MYVSIVCKVQLLILSHSLHSISLSLICSNSKQHHNNTSHHITPPPLLCDCTTCLSNDCRGRLLCRVEVRSCLCATTTRRVDLHNNVDSEKAQVLFNSAAYSPAPRRE